jgi:small neutral amino acid transporter SnatA (MarC family)
MNPAIAELAVPKICGEGVLATTMMGMNMEDDAYIGMGFKYIKKTDFFSFEVYADKC